ATRAASIASDGEGAPDRGQEMRPGLARPSCLRFLVESLAAGLELRQPAGEQRRDVLGDGGTHVEHAAERGLVDDVAHGVADGGARRLPVLAGHERHLPEELAWAEHGEAPVYAVDAHAHVDAAVRDQEQRVAGRALTDDVLAGGEALLAELVGEPLA